MRRAHVRFAVLAAALALPVMPPSVQAAVGPGAVTWTVDHSKHTITVAAHLQIHLGPCTSSPGAPGGAEGGPGTTGRDCSARARQIGDEIRNNIESTWNGHSYKCYRLIFKVDVSEVADRSSVDDDRVGVLIDRSVEPIRSHVRNTLRYGSGDRWQSNEPADRVVVDNSRWVPTTWAYPPITSYEYAHEFGHVLGLDDAYVETAMVPKPFAPVDLMSASVKVIDQTTVDRAVERNRDHLFDTKGRQVALKDLTCDMQFIASLTADEVHHDASNLMNSIVDRPCPRAPQTSSREQSLRVESERVRVFVVDAPEVTSMGYLMGPIVDVLQAQNGATVARDNADPSWFNLPVTVRVTRSRNDPAIGPIPEVYDFQEKSCPGGDVPGQKPPPDCGVRTYRTWLAMTRSGADELWLERSSIPVYLAGIASPRSPRLETLYRNCDGPTPWPGYFMEGHADTTVTRGKLPSLAEVSKVARDWYHDQKPGRIEIRGGSGLDTAEPGSLENDQLTWTLTLCPVDADDKTPPDCP
jgi:hypothetical protein